MQKQYLVDVYIENPNTNNYHKHGKQAQVTAHNPDAALDAVRKMISDKKHPPIRSINHGPNDTIVVYCKQSETIAEPARANEDVRWKRPQGPKRL